MGLGGEADDVDGVAFVAVSLSSFSLIAEVDTEDGVAAAAASLASFALITLPASAWMCFEL